MMMKTNLSARPKVRNSNTFNEAKITFEPLDKKMINFIDQDGNKRSIPFISKEFSLKMQCVTYFEPSFEELNSLSQMALHNWIINCRKYESMLSQLVSLPYFRFWSIMSFNGNVLASLNSYMVNASRPYRLHPLLKNNEIKSTLGNIHKLTFKVWVRVLLSKESEKNHMSGSFHSGLVRQIVDIPKLLSILQLYGYGSKSEILCQLLKPFISPENGQFKQEFTLTCNDITLLLNQYSEDDNSMMFQIGNVTDLFFSLNKLVIFEPKLSAIYVECQLHEAVIAFYSKYFLFIEDKCEERLKKGQIVENLFKFFQSQLILIQSSALLLFHHILQNDFINRINQSNSDTQMFDSLINILNSVIGQKRFCFDYFTRFSFDAEFNSLLMNCELNEQLSIGDVLEYYKITLKSTIQEFHAQGIEKNRVDNSIMNSGLMSFSYKPQGEQSQANSQSSQRDQTSTQLVATSVPVNRIRMDSEITAKEEMIREMFPDCSNGFAYKCLEAYAFSPDRAIDAILEDKLPPQLATLSRKLTKNDLLRAQEVAAQKEAAAVKATVAQYDPTSKKELVPAQIFIGKKDKFSQIQAQKEANKAKTIELLAKIQDEEEEMKENVKVLVERGKLTKQDIESNIEYVGMYDDEFDDTYENEDVSFDVQHEAFDCEKEEEAEDGDQRKNLNPFSGGPQRGSMPLRQNAEKFSASQRYSKKQFYNKRNFNHGKGKASATPQQPSGDVRSQSGPQHSTQQSRRNPSNSNNSQADERAGTGAAFGTTFEATGQSGNSGRNMDNNGRSNSNNNRGQLRNPQMQTNHRRGNQGGGRGGGQNRR